jgi:hypothetical protein
MFVNINPNQRPQRVVKNINNIILVSPSPFASKEVWEEYLRKKQEFEKQNERVPQ